MSRRRRRTSRNRNRSRTYRRRHRASSRRRRSRTAGVSDSEELGALEELGGLEYLKSRIGSLSHMSWEEDEVPHMIRIASINNRTKNNIYECCDYCRGNAYHGSSTSPNCYRQCVQFEIDRTKKAIQLHTLQKVNTRLGTQIPSEIGRRIADYI